jgi:uncharacterized phiE125 gp8 family phage protein
MANRIVLSGPDQEPITVAQVRDHSRLDTLSIEDNYLQMLIAVARDVAENHTWLSIAEKTYLTALDAFPVGAIELDPHPVTEIVSVQYDDLDGNTQTLDPSNYQVDLIGIPARIIPLNDWPGTQERANAVRITYKAGYTPATLPPQLRHALVVLVDHYYENRGEVVTGTIVSQLPMAARALLENLNMRAVS